MRRRVARPERHDAQEERPVELEADERLVSVAAMRAYYVGCGVEAVAPELRGFRPVGKRTHRRFDNGGNVGPMRFESTKAGCHEEEEILDQRLIAPPPTRYVGQRRLQLVGNKGEAKALL